MNIALYIPLTKFDILLVLSKVFAELFAAAVAAAAAVVVAVAIHQSAIVVHASVFSAQPAVFVKFPQVGNVQPIQFQGQTLLFSVQQPMPHFHQVLVPKRTVCFRQNNSLKLNKYLRIRLHV